MASTDDGEALVINPAGLAKVKGTAITISAAMINYAMEFQRRGTYSAVAGEDYPYEGQPYPVSRNDARPSLGIGRYQPVPVITAVSDLGGAVPGLHVAIGLYAPNAYPFRDMCSELASGCERYVFNDDANAPPSTRYDILSQDAAVTLPSIAAAYQILPSLDFGLRLSAGRAALKSTSGLWAGLGPNYAEDVQRDGVFSVDAEDNFVPAFGLGATFRPTPHIELGASYASQLSIHAKGTSVSQLGPQASDGIPASIGARTEFQCESGGTVDVQKACVDFAIPATAQIGGRYKFLDSGGVVTADVELDLGWEHWGKGCSDDAFNDGSCVSPGDYRVVADTSVFISAIGLDVEVPLNDAIVKHGLRDTYSVRVGGSYHIPVGPRGEHAAGNEIILRGGLGYDTAAARTGWLRADLDGAARTTVTLGAAYRGPGFEVSVGGGTILEGSPSNPNVGGGAEPCATSDAMPSCNAGGRQGPDPINPLVERDAQNEHPITQGDYKAHYVLLMLGATAWF